jgi:heme oxygenase (mycobilin-producing)
LPTNNARDNMVDNCRTDAYVPQPAGGWRSKMFVALSRFTVTNGMTAQVKEAFMQRPHLVDRAPGFVRMEVWNAQDTDAEFWLVTYWADEHSFHDWHTHHRHESHARMPQGLKLVPGSAEVRYFQQVCE